MDFFRHELSGEDDGHVPSQTPPFITGALMMWAPFRVWVEVAWGVVERSSKRPSLR